MKPPKIHPFRIFFLRSLREWKIFAISIGIFNLSEFRVKKALRYRPKKRETKKHRSEKAALNSIKRVRVERHNPSRFRIPRSAVVNNISLKPEQTIFSFICDDGGRPIQTRAYFNVLITRVFFSSRVFFFF